MRDTMKYQILDPRRCTGVAAVGAVLAVVACPGSVSKHL
jgi:hypothetical protein